MRLVPLDLDLLGFCDVCFRVRWLRLERVEETESPHGVCRSCARDDAESAATLAYLLDPDA